MLAQILLRVVQVVFAGEFQFDGMGCGHGERPAMRTLAILEQPASKVRQWNVKIASRSLVARRYSG
jgi:hypothetical protein